MRRLALVLAALVPCVPALATDQKPANPPAVRAEAVKPLGTTWDSRGQWDRSSFNRSVQVDAAGRTALGGAGRFSLEVVATGDKGEVMLRFFDASGAPRGVVPGHVVGIGRHEAAPAGKTTTSGTWTRSQNWADAGFDAASPFSTKALGDGSVRVELRSSKFRDLKIEATVPAVQTRAR